MVSVANKWKAAVLICIIVALAFLVAWQIGRMWQPPTETITLEPVSWEFAHPTGDYLLIDQWQNASFADNVCSLAFATIIGDYYTTGSFGTLRFASSVDILGKSPNFYVKTASVSFANLTGTFGVEINSLFVSFKNLSLASLRTDSVQLVGNSSSKSAYLSAPTMWDLNTPANYTCKATVVVEVTYFNGTAYRQVVQPINLTLRGDRHILEINDALLVGAPPMTGVRISVWVNGTQYTTPVSLLLPPATYVVKVESPILHNSTSYSFLYWSTSNTANPLTLSLTGDTTLQAFFMQQ
jgi:hypothetical protein